MNRVASAAIGGFAGMCVMSVFLILLEVETRSRIGLFGVIARFVGLPGQVFVGFLVFFAAGTVAWPLLFLGLERYGLGGVDPAIRGMALASVLWVVFVVTGSGDLDGAILLLYGTFTLLGHLAYGFTLGAVYARLSARPEG